MDEIIVGIDFSRGSECAIELGIDIANRMKHDIKLVYVTPETNDNDASKDDTESKIKALISRYSPMLHKTTMDYNICKGKVAEELSGMAKANNATMVIVGSHGTSGYEKDWIGRNAYKTIEDTECPVITVRENFNFNKDLERIVVPIDSSMETRQKLPMAAKMAKLFNSQIHILGLYTSESIMPMVNKYVEQVEKFLQKYNIEYSTDKMGCQNITDATLEYAYSINADLIVIMTEQEKRFSNIMLGSYAQQMIHRSMIPIMTIHPEEINSASR